METMLNFAFMTYKQFFAPCDVNPTGLRRARDRGRSSTILLRVDATMLE